MIGITNLHFNQLITYIFNKPENRALAGGDQQMKLQKLTALYETIKQSKDYRLERWLVDQVRKLKIIVPARSMKNCWQSNL